MSHIESSIFDKRNSYRRRRNVIRRIFLILFVVLLTFLLYQIILIPKKCNLKIEIANNSLANTEIIIKSLNEYLNHKNFFLIYPNQLSEYLLKSNKLINELLIRKYVFPEYKVIVFIKEEKKIWAKLKDEYISNEGDIIPVAHLNLVRLPQDIVPISLEGSYLTREQFMILKNIYDLLTRKLKIVVNKLVIKNNLSLEIYLNDEYVVNAGLINSDLVSRILNLQNLLQEVKKSSHLIKYLDLTLENGAVLRENPKSDMKKGFFWKRKKLI